MAVALLSAFHVGVRLPNLWSVNYFIPGVFDGVWRRGLLGTLLTPFDPLRFHYGFVMTLQVAIFLALLAVMLRQGLRRGLPGRIIVIAFLFAPTGGYMFHQIGYVEQLLYLLLAAALAMPRSAAAAALVAISLFIHELALFTIVPLYLANLVAERRYRAAAAHGAVILAAFVLIYVAFQTTTPDVAEALLKKVRAHANYEPRADYYEVFTSTLTSDRMRFWYGPGQHKVSLLVGFVAGLAAVASVRRPLGDGLPAAIAILGACLAPLLLGFVGWDTGRWFFLSLCSSMAVLIGFGCQPRLWVAATFAAAFAVFAAAGHLPYFDDFKARPVWPALWSPSHLLEFFTKELPLVLTTVPSR